MSIMKSKFRHHFALPAPVGSGSGDVARKPKLRCGQTVVARLHGANLPALSATYRAPRCRASVSEFAPGVLATTSDRTGVSVSWATVADPALPQERASEMAGRILDFMIDIGSWLLIATKNRCRSWHVAASWSRSASERAITPAQ